MRISLEPFIISAAATMPFMSQEQKDLFDVGEQLIIPEGAFDCVTGFEWE